MIKEDTKGAGSSDNPLTLASLHKAVLQALLLPCLLTFCFVSAGYAQQTLPYNHGGPWATGLPEGWSANLGPDYDEVELGNSKSGGAAGFDYDYNYLTVNFDRALVELTYWLTFYSATSFEGNEFQVLESSDGKNFTLLASHTSIPQTDTLGTKYTVKPSEHARWIKFHFAVVKTNTMGVSVLLDDITLTASTAIPLPVELATFKATKQRKGAVLSWTTASEKDNDRFEIEMSYDPKSGFERIGSVKSKVGTSSLLTRYTYTHEYWSKGGTRYYRLRQVDTDGTFSYSKLVAVTAMQQTGDVLSVAPNPLDQSSLVLLMAEKSGKASLTLTSTTGQRVYAAEMAVSAGENEVSLPVYGKMAPGLYILAVILEGQAHYLKVLKR